MYYALRISESKPWISERRNTVQEQTATICRGWVLHNLPVRRSAWGRLRSVLGPIATFLLLL